MMDSRARSTRPTLCAPAHIAPSANARADAPQPEFCSFLPGEEWHRDRPGECTMFMCLSQIGSDLRKKREKSPARSLRAGIRPVGGGAKGGELAHRSAL